VANSGLWSKLENRHLKNMANNNIYNNGYSSLYQSITNEAPAYGNTFGSSYSNDSDSLIQGVGGFAKLANTFKGNGTTGSDGGGFWSNFGGGSSSGGGGGSVPWALIANTGKKGYNAIAKKDDKDYSDLEESIIYTAQGAGNGASFGPWGALGGALYGLGYSFKDDLGLKDSNFFTQLTFPIDMGDGGGLKIGGKSVLSL
jgi:hypothetical protein